MKNCFVIGASKNGNIYIPDSDKQFIIAADGGYNQLTEMGIEPDLILGDFDSSDMPENKNNILVFPREKDDTDMAIAIEKGIEKGCENFFLFGGTGGRADHTFANFQLLYYLAERGKRGYLFYENSVVTVISDSKIRYPLKNKGYISVFSYGEQAEGVTISGLKYELENEVLYNNKPLGVSNEFIGKASEISVIKGSLIILWEDDIIKTVKERMK